MADEGDGKGGGQASKGGTDSEGPDFVKVAGVFVEGQRTVATEDGMAGFGRVVIGH